jgi:hypothetical protein
MSDNLDEFFDFDQLEHDHGAQTADRQYRQHVDPFSYPENSMAMDWDANSPAPPSTLDALLPHDIHMTNFLDHHSILDQPQWPLVAAQHQTLLEQEASTQVCQDPSCMRASTATGEQFPSSIAPSSLLSCGHRVLTRVADGINDAFDATLDASLPGHDLPSLDIVAPPTSDNVPILIPDRPTGPLRQASTASWKPASAKRKCLQSRIPLEARQILEDEFIANPYPCSWEMDIIAHQANLDVKKVRNWFNNTRARKKSGGEHLLSLLTWQPYSHS